MLMEQSPPSYKFIGDIQWVHKFPISYHSDLPFGDLTWQIISLAQPSSADNISIASFGITADHPVYLQIAGMASNSNKDQGAFNVYIAQYISFFKDVLSIIPIHFILHLDISYLFCQHHLNPKLNSLTPKLLLFFFFELRGSSSHSIDKLCHLVHIPQLFLSNSEVCFYFLFTQNHILTCCRSSVLSTCHR
jgi:hypothetical protein